MKNRATVLKHLNKPTNQLLYSTLSLSLIQRYCDVTGDGDGWTVVQRRGMFGSPYLNFTQDWDSYKAGFGDHTREFWWGNDNMHRWGRNCGATCYVNRSVRFAASERYIHQVAYTILMGTHMCPNLRHLHVAES